jgi:hypothetical protein
MQTTPFTDHRGQFWHPDKYLVNGRLSAQTRPLVDSPDSDHYPRELTLTFEPIVNNATISGVEVLD